MTDKIVVLSTCDSEEQAERIARDLIEKRLAACVNIVPGARSIYRWKDGIEDVREFVLLIKSRRELFEALRAAVASVHTYELPELIALPVVEGAEEYLTWIDNATNSSGF